MTVTSRRLIRSWLSGALVGTLVVAVTSPLFVRSYVPLKADASRGVWVLPPGQWYRWRSEGYANTQIGPMGMPGKTLIAPPERGKFRVALWGDSQAEGVCVADDEKLFAQAEALSENRLQVFPFARSGEDAADWLTQMPALEQSLDLDFHVLLVVDLQDLLTASQAPLPPPSEADVAAGNASIAAIVPAFIIQAARYLLTEPDEMTPRRLRFSLGPVGPVNGDTGTAESTASEGPDAKHASGIQSMNYVDALTATDAEAREERQALWRREMQAIRAASSLPILILRAPVAPQIVAGHVVMESDPQQDAKLMASAAAKVGILVTSAEDALKQSALAGSWPHGFQNGYIGSGHLNRNGNALVASILVREVLHQLTGGRSMPSGDDDEPRRGN